MTRAKIVDTVMVLGAIIGLLWFIDSQKRTTDHATDHPDQAQTSPEPPKPIGHADFTDKDWAMIQGLAPSIRAMDYVCDAVSSARNYGRHQQGLTLWVLCNHDALGYKVVITPQKRVLISPW